MPDLLKLWVGMIKTLIYDVVQQLAQPSDRLIDRLGVDVLDIGRVFNEKGSDWTKIKLNEKYEAYNPAWFKPEPNGKGGWVNYHKDGTPIASMPEGANFYDQTYFPWVDGYPEGRKAMEESIDEAMDKVLWSNMVHSPWDHAEEPDFWVQLRKKNTETQRRE